VPRIFAEDNNEKLESLFDYIMEYSELTPPMIMVAFNICPQLLLDHLNPYQIIHGSKWIRMKDSFVLRGVIDPIECFTIKDMQSIVDKYSTSLDEILSLDLISKKYRQLDGTIVTRKSASDIVSEYIEKLLETQEERTNWRYDTIIKQLYDAYEKIQSTKLSNIWKSLIKFFNQCVTVNVQDFVYSDIPTSRSSIIITNINLNTLTKIYPEVVINVLNNISSTPKQKLYWYRIHDSLTEYYSTASNHVFDTLNQYSTSLVKLGLNLEDLAVKQATEKFLVLEKAINRQTSKKGTNYDRDAKWAELLQNEKHNMRVNRFRLTINITSPEIIENLRHLESTTQMKHLREISYIYIGIEMDL
jgi:hypothetical protein